MCRLLGKLRPSCSQTCEQHVIGAARSSCWRCQVSDVAARSAPAQSVSPVWLEERWSSFFFFRIKLKKKLKKKQTNKPRRHV